MNICVYTCESTYLARKHFSLPYMQESYKSDIWEV